MLVPPSEASDTDDHDSVHSLPVGSTRTKVAVCVASVSSGHTPHASYADIARHAAALQTQQQGQKQHDVYREQLQYRSVYLGFISAHKKMNPRGTNSTIFFTESISLQWMKVRSKIMSNLL